MKLAEYDEAEAFNTLPAQGTSARVSDKLGQILVVDDEVELKNALVEILNAQGYTALGCTSGRDALEALREQNFDVLLSDLMMPEMDGVALLDAALEIDQHLVCIIMTGQGTIQTAVDAMKVGAFDYVLKPFRLQALLPVLTRAINVRRLRQENLQLRETVAIYELCQTIAFTLDRQTLLSKLADSAMQQSEADEVSILLLTSDGSELYVAAVRGENRTRLLNERVPLEQGISSWVARERTPLLLEGQVNDARFTAMWPRADIRSAISVPLQVAGKLVGIINVNNISGPRPFTLGQMKALAILASTAAAALESATLYERVRQAEEKYRSIFDNAVEGIFQSTPEGRFTTVNTSMARILGYDSPEEVITTITYIAHQLYVDPEYQAEAARIQEEHGVIHGFEFEAYRKDGEKIWLSLNRRSVWDENGVEIYREGSVEDITERKRAEEALRASEAELRALFAAMTDVILVLDAEGRYQKIAPTDPAYLYKPSADLLGKRLHEVFPKEEVDFFLAHIRRALDEGQMHRVEYSLQISGTEVWFDGSVSPMSKDSVIWIARDITERKRVEEALRESEEQYRVVAETATDAIVTIDENSTILFANGAVERVFGYDASELLGKQLMMLMPEYLRHIHDAAVGRYVQTGQKHINWEAVGVPGLHKSGREIPLEISFGQFIKDGRRFFTGIARDISERKQAEEQLRRQLDFTETITASLGEGLYALDTSGRLTFMNSAAERALGWTQAELLGQKTHEIVHFQSADGISRPADDCPLLGVLNSGQMIQVEGDVFTRKDGSSFPVSYTSSPIITGGQIAGAVLAFHDITERKRAEAELRKSEAQYRRLLDTTYEGVLVFDAEMRITYVNQRLAEMVGVSVEKLIGRSALKFVINTSHDYIERQWQHRVEGIKEQYDLRLQRKDGSDLWVIVCATPIVGEHGEFIGSLCMMTDITERRLADEALKESEARFQSAFDHAPVGIALVAPDGRFVQINHSFGEIVGYTKEELMVSDVLSLTHKDDHVATLEHIRRLLDGEVKTCQLEKRYLHKLGHEVLALTNLSLMRDAENNPLYLIAQIQDITERKRAEEALGESEVRYRLLFESNPLPMWVYDLETFGFLAVNEAAIQHYGYSLQEFQGMTVMDIRPLEDIPALLENISRVGDKRDEAGVWTHRKKDGTLIDVAITSHPFAFAGRASELVLAHDVTEQKHAVEALQHEKEYTEHIIASAPTLIVGIAPDGVTTFINRAVTSVTGYEPEEIVGQNWWRINYPATEYVQVDRLLEEFEQGRAVANYEMSLTTKNGGKRTISWNSANRSNKQGEIVEVIGIGVDITDRQQLEEQLRQSQKLEAVGQLAGGVAHDFNNLLTVITGYSDLTLRRLDNKSPFRSSLEEIKKAGERAASLTRQLLAFSRKQVLQPKVLKLNAIVADIDKMLRRLIGEDIDALTLLEPSLGQVKADPGQIEQVILNLAVNARDAMPQGGKLTIETANVYLDDQYARGHTTIQPGRYVMLSVSDTGCGIDAETQARMFEPFFTTKEQGKGTGLGLSTVYGIVKQSGGHLWVYSEVGKGTTFKIYLPRVDEVIESDEARDTLAELPQGRETVLLTEDEEQVRQMIRMILEMSGYCVLEASDGEEALAIYKQHEGEIDLVMTDVVMPQMSGRELAQSLEVLHPGIKVLYMSGYTDDAIVRHGLLDQEIAFLQKPFTPDVLIRKVREVLDVPHVD
jgi:PAS domain S-box-containing protein